jgi:hypothetical protein
MARVLVASDDFNRTDGSPGSNWTQTNTDAGTMAIATNQIQPGNSLGPSSMVWAGAGSFNNNQYAKLKLTAITFGDNNYGIGVTVRASNDLTTTRDHYFFIAGTSGLGTLGKTVNGTVTTLHSATVGWATNDTIELEAEGTTVRAMKNGVALGGSFTVTDTSLSTGKPGVTGTGDSGVAKGDDWESGNLVTASAIARLLGKLIGGGILLTGLVG